VNTLQPPLHIYTRKQFTVNTGHHRLLLGTRTHIMGIINITPDSFSRDGCGTHPNITRRVLNLAQKQINDGADIIDVGGESTRPGAVRVSVTEEINRVTPSIKLLAKKTKVPISVDTYKPSVAKAALDAGASIINNIMGTNPGKSLLKMVKNYNAAIILMHIRGTPRTMQRRIHYSNLIEEILQSLKFSVEKCLEAGIPSDNIIIDPGFGFGKTVKHNLEILNRLDAFKTLNFPLLIGTSRKSFIGKILNRDIEHRLFGTAATVNTGVLKGAHIVRVHDVRQIKDTVMMTDAIINGNYN